jgi:hypothetical protein
MVGIAGKHFVRNKGDPLQSGDVIFGNSCGNIVKCLLKQSMVDALLTESRYLVPS